MRLHILLFMNLTPPSYGVLLCYRIGYDPARNRKKKIPAVTSYMNDEGAAEVITEIGLIHTHPILVAHLDAISIIVGLS